VVVLAAALAAAAPPPVTELLLDCSRFVMAAKIPDWEMVERGVQCFTACPIACSEWIKRVAVANGLEYGGD
jgi:hypothetical protein